MKGGCSDWRYQNFRLDTIPINVLPVLFIHRFRYVDTLSFLTATNRDKDVQLTWSHGVTALFLSVVTWHKRISLILLLLYLGVLQHKHRYVVSYPIRCGSDTWAVFIYLLVLVLHDSNWYLCEYRYIDIKEFTSRDTWKEQMYKK